MYAPPRTLHAAGYRSRPGAAHATCCHRRGSSVLRIAFVVRTFDVGGIEGHLVALCRGLLERGHETLVAVAEGGGTLVPELRALGTSVHEVTERGISGLPFGLPGLVRTLREWEPDLLDGCLAFGNVLAVSLKPLLPGTRVAITIQVLAPERDSRQLAVRALYGAETLAARGADLVMTNSEAGRSHAVGRGFDSRRVCVVPNGVDTTLYCRDSEARARLRASWAVGDDELLVGRVGRLRPSKDYATFLAAAAVASVRCPALRFLCVGDGPLRSDLEALGHDLGLDGRIIWTGERRDIPAVMSALDFMVSSSVTESAPNVLGEAMACGAPCVVTDTGDCARIVAGTGIVVPPRAPDALADAMLAMVERLARDGATVRAAARRRVEEHFGLDAMVTRTERAFAAAIETERR